MCGVADACNDNDINWVPRASLGIGPQDFCNRAIAPTWTMSRPQRSKYKNHYPSTRIVLRRTPGELLKIGTGDSRLVCKMHHNRPVAQKGRGPFGQRRIVIDVPNLQPSLGLAILAAQIAHLAGILGPAIARGIFASAVRVQVGERLGAVAIGGDAVLVDVVDCCIKRQYGRRQAGPGIGESKTYGMVRPPWAGSQGGRRT